METFVHPICAVALGVLLSLCFFLISTDNPSRIPLHKVLFRSLFGMVLYIFTWLIISYPVYLVLLATYSRMGSLEGLGLLCFACGVGLSVPIVTRTGKNHLIGRRTAKTYHLLTTVLQFIDEVTSQYFGRIIMREERKASYQVLEPDPHQAECAIGRLFEFYLEEIAREQAQDMETSEREKVFNFVKVRSSAIKFKFLLRHLGYTTCLAKINSVKAAPTSILPSWPSDVPDRRHDHDRRKADDQHVPERRLLSHGRRKMDSPNLRNFILGHSHKALSAKDHQKLEGTENS